MAAAVAYEEILATVVDALSGKLGAERPWNMVGLKAKVNAAYQRRPGGGQQPTDHYAAQALGRRIEALVEDAFWDLFRQGLVSLQSNSGGAGWDSFRLSARGDAELDLLLPFRFHDTATYEEAVRSRVPRIDTKTITYLREAATCFYSGSLLAATVMLGVAAEIEFLLLADAATTSRAFGTFFSKVQQESKMARKVAAFRRALEANRPQMSHSRISDGTDSQFAAIQDLIRLARNDAGHAMAPAVSREVAYNYLRLFIPFAEFATEIADYLRGT